MRQIITTITGLLFTVGNAKIHHLFVGNLGPPSALYALSFDTDTFDLKVTKNITGTGSHHWLTFSNQKTSIYATSFRTPEISSYSVLKGGTDLRLDKVLRTTNRCGNNDRSAHVVTLQREPHTVFMSSWPGKPGCGTVYSTLPNETLSSVVQSFDYSETSGIHGLAMHPSDAFMYAADTTRDSLWTHDLSANGTVSKSKRTDVSKIGKGPRHIAAHPNGSWLYTLFEGSNTISAFPVNAETGSLGSPSLRYSLLPGDSYKSPVSSGAPPHDERYWSAEITISPSSRILWATARAQTNTPDFGYISAFSLSPEGEIVDRLFIVPTTTPGGIANSVSVAPDTDEFVAMTDLKDNGRGQNWGYGYVQIWQVKGLNGTAPTAKMVAQADIKDGGCCANVIWYD